MYASTTTVSLKTNIAREWRGNRKKMESAPVSAKLRSCHCHIRKAAFGRRSATAVQRPPTTDPCARLRHHLLTAATRLTMAYELSTRARIEYWITSRGSSQENLAVPSRQAVMDSYKVILAAQHVVCLYGRSFNSRPLTLAIIAAVVHV